MIIKIYEVFIFLLKLYKNIIYYNNKKYAKFIQPFILLQKFTKGHKRKSEQMGRRTIFLMGKLTIVTKQFSPGIVIEIPIKSQWNCLWNLGRSVKVWYVKTERGRAKLKAE